MKKIKIKSTILRLPQGLRPFAMTGRKLSKKALAAFFTFILVILPVTLLILFNSAKGVEAAWANEDWGYRYPITITNSTGSTQTNLQKLLTIDTSTLVTAGKLQSDCDDLRFTAQNGTVLPYYIDSGCNTTTTKVWVLIDSLPTNGSVIYMYYGNPGAVAGSNSKEFDNVVGLVGYWTMNDTSGSTATDSSVNANNGTATGTTIVSGQKGNARNFNGTSDYVSTNWTQSSVTKYTISAWVKVPTDQTSDATIVENRGTGQGKSLILGVTGTNPCGSGCFANTTGMPTIGLHSDGEFAGIRGTTAINDNNWHHIVGTWEAPSGTVVNTSQFTLYIDGIKLTSTVASGSSGTASPLTGLGGTRIGAYQAWNTYFKGQLDDVRIYNTARTADQISSDYTKTYTIQTSPLTVTTANGSEEKAPSPVAYWKFDDGTGTTAQDSTTNNNDGTLTNGPSWQTEDMCVSGKCLKFDGSNDIVNSSNSIAYASSTITLSFWTRINSYGASNQIIFESSTNYNDNDKAFVAYTNTSGSLLFGIQDSSTTNKYRVESITGPSLNTWHFFTVVYDNSTSTGDITVYMDGISQTTTITTNDKDQSGNFASFPLYIGARSGGTSAFSGFIDEPKIYNYARSSAQILADFNSRSSSEGLSANIGNSDQGKSLSNGLVGYWKMDESSWTNNCTATSVTDSSGNSNNGKACPATTGPTGGAAGKFGNGGSFDGSDDYVEVANSTSLQPLTGNWAVGFWMYRLGIGSGDFPQIIGSRPWTTSVDKGWAVAWDSANNKICPHFADGSTGFDVNNVTCSSSTSTLNTWEHWTVVFDRTNSKVNYYKNGVLDGSISVTYPSGSINQTDTVNIAREIGGLNNRRLNARLDETRIYNRALSPAEVTQLYNFAPGPVAYYDFNENTGSTVNDRSGNGNTGTWNGSGTDQWKPGKNGSSGNFTASSSDYVSLPDNAIPATPTQFTLQGWFKTSSDGGIVNRLSAAHTGYRMVVWGGVILFTISSNTTVDYTNLSGTIAVNDNKWHFATTTWDGATMKVYVDGKLDASTARTTIASGGTGIANIGYNIQAGSRMNGQIDDVKVYNYARTQQQIVEDMTSESDVGGSGYTSANSSTGGSIAKPVGYWKFDEGYSTTANNVGNGGTALNGTLTNMSSPATSTSGWTQAGKVGKGLVFDGTDDYVSLPNDSALNITSNQITMSAWVYRTVTGDFDQVISKATGTGTSSRQYAMYIDATAGGLGCNVVAGSVVDLISSIIRVTTNTWTHISCVYDGATLKGYVNGIQASSTALTGNIVTQNTGVNIGRFNTGVSYFNGTLDEVKIYNFPLTADQVKLDMNQGAAAVYGNLGNASTSSANSAAQEYCVPGDTASCAAPVGKWDFDEATGTTANDSSGNANTGTLTNGPTWKPGKVNKSLNFDGSDDYVSVADSMSIGASFTASAWVKSDGSTWNDYGWIMASRVANGFMIHPYINDTIWSAVIFNSSGSFTEIFAPTVSNINNWHQYTISYDASTTTVKMYVDGNLVKEQITSITRTNDTIPIEIGRDGGRYGKGQIDQVRIFNYARSAAQIAWDYNKGAPVGHWRMDECQGSTANDASGNSNTGTITIGSSGTQTSAGTCTDGSSTSAWYNGRTGKKNYSLNFDGTDDYVNISNLTLGSTFSISSWIKPTTYNGNYPMWITANGVPDLELGGQTGGTLFYSGGQYFSTSFSSLPLDTWSYLTYVVSSGNIQLYINGILKETKSYTPTSLSTINLGQYFNNTSRFGGSLDDVRVYNYPLTATQVKTLFSEGAYRSGPSTGAP